MSEHSLDLSEVQAFEKHDHVILHYITTKGLIRRIGYSLDHPDPLAQIISQAQALSIVHGLKLDLIQFEILRGKDTPDDSYLPNELQVVFEESKHQDVLLGSSLLVSATQSLGTRPAILLKKILGNEIAGYLQRKQLNIYPQESFDLAQKALIGFAEAALFDKKIDFMFKNLSDPSKTTKPGKRSDTKETFYFQNYEIISAFEFQTTIEHAQYCSQNHQWSVLLPRLHQCPICLSSSSRKFPPRLALINLTAWVYKRPISDILQYVTQWSIIGSQIVKWMLEDKIWVPSLKNILLLPKMIVLKANNQHYHVTLWHYEKDTLKVVLLENSVSAISQPIRNQWHILGREKWNLISLSRKLGLQQKCYNQEISELNSRTGLYQLDAALISHLE